MCSLLGQTVARKEIDISQSLRDVLLCLFVESLFDNRSRCYGSLRNPMLSFFLVGLRRQWFRRRDRRTACALAEFIQSRDYAFVVLIAFDEFLQQRFRTGKVSRGGIGI